jgi:hypothetical protein
VQGRQFGAEPLVALRQALEGQLHCGHGGDHRTRTQARCGVDRAVARERAHLLTLAVDETETELQNPTFAQPQRVEDVLDFGAQHRQ